MWFERVRRSQLAPGLGLVLVLVLIAWLYAPILRFGFVMFDDDINLYGNPHIGELTWERFVWAWTGQDYLPRVMPLAWLIVMAIFGAAGMEPWAFHGYNLCLHLANTALVFGVARMAFRQAARAEGRSDRTWTSWLALAAAAGWGLHPLRSESVAWATGWVYTSASFFALASAWFLLGRLEFDNRARRWRMAVAVAAFAAAALIYPLALGFPAAALAFEWWLGRLKSPEAPLLAGWQRLTQVHVWLVALSLVVLGWNVWARVVKNRTYPASPSLREFGVENRLAQAVTTMPYYAARMTWAGDSTPVWETREPGSFREPRVLFWAALVALWVGWAWWGWRRAPGGLAAGFAFAGAVAPFSGLMDYPFLPNDRYGYLPGAVLMIALVLAFRGVRSGGGRVLLGLVFCLWIFWLAASVPRQLPKWADTEALMEHVRAGLKSQDGRVLYGVVQARHRARRGDFEASRTLLSEIGREAGPQAVAAALADVERLERLARTPTAIRVPRGLVPADAALPYRMALRDAEAGENTGAYHRYRQALANDPDFHDARYNFALWLASTGRVQEAEAQADELRRRAGTALDPKMEGALAGIIEQARGLAGGRD